VAIGNLTDLQLAVMKALWQVGEGTVADVLAAMLVEGRALAPTTVATLLRRLAKQGWVAHRRHGRRFLYRAKIHEKEAATGLLHRLVSAFFGGRVSALAAQLLEAEELSPEDLEAMRKLIRKKGG
jgi:predicted transcriptional regulator